MTTEEVDLNERLEHNGLESVETISASTSFNWRTSGPTTSSRRRST